METRRFKTRNGADLAFSVVGQGMGPIGDFYELLDEKMTIATIEQAYASGHALVRHLAALRQRAFRIARWVPACATCRARR